ncbi:hypothetical protein GVN16_03870 [Emticicia sp. CRIBPO]|uniref:hypothetical protein n=1 Tax=Emticicia sp. CRIBPO TaxID=2683258 RepID=UPI001412DC20|nr:hypothetical protein [Emticicia sp. CRIBPO]NBA84880.1 hypothetical protein [Emticicia sp. CRIBPO]
MKKHALKLLWISLCLILAVADLSAQQILIDKPLRIGSVTVFPDLNNPNDYYYLPDKARIATAANGQPQFSFLRYVQNVRGGAETETREGDGGGIVHAVIELSLTPAMLEQARGDLRRVNSAGTIKGPIIYAGGSIALISSVSSPEGGLSTKILGLGKAPILDGGKASVSIQLTKQGSKILWESFKTPTPDMSISFEMDLKGFRSPKRAIVEANFEQVYQHTSFQAAIAAPILAAEINTAFDDLVKTGAIKVTLIGADENMEKAVDEAYTKLTRLMFEPVGGTGTPELGSLTGAAANRPSLLDRATTMLNNARTETRQDNEKRRQQMLESLPPDAINRPRTSTDTSRRASPLIELSDQEAERVERAQERREREQQIQATQQALPQFAIAAVFEMKRVRQQGTFRIDLNKYTADQLTIRFDENFGQINCQACFREVNLDDPLYKQREIVSYLDGMNADDFGKYINFVAVQIQKKHENGDLTQDEIRIDKTNFNQSGNNFKMLYGWKGDNNRTKWLKYDYKVTWNFFGGQSVTSDYKPVDVAAIPLAPPFSRKLIDVEADPTAIQAANVRSIEVKVFYKQGTQELNRQIRLNTKANQFSGQIEIIQPKEANAFDYEIVWFLNNGQSKNSGRLSSASTIIFADNLPN